MPIVTLLLSLALYLPDVGQGLPDASFAPTVDANAVWPAQLSTRMPSDDARDAIINTGCSNYFAKDGLNAVEQCFGIFAAVVDDMQQRISSVGDSPGALALTVCQEQGALRARLPDCAEAFAFFLQVNQNRPDAATDANASAGQNLSSYPVAVALGQVIAYCSPMALCLSEPQEAIDSALGL